MRINEEFASFQGEINVGRFAYFIRLGQCNLKCIWCDSKYANTEWVDIPVDDIVKKAIHFPRVVITGGEPFLQKDEVAKLVQKIKRKNPKTVIEIETNGTIKPIGLGSHDIIYNVSIKLKNSGNDYKDRIKLNVLNWYIQNESNFKFVVNDEDDIDEVNMLVKDLGISKSQVFLMPEGTTSKEQWTKMETIIKHAKYYGYNFSPRFHVLLWNNIRGV